MCPDRVSNPYLGVWGQCSNQLSYSARADTVVLIERQKRGGDWQVALCRAGRAVSHLKEAEGSGKDIFFNHTQKEAPKVEAVPEGTGQGEDLNLFS